MTVGNLHCPHCLTSSFTIPLAGHMAVCTGCGAEVEFLDGLMVGVRAAVQNCQLGPVPEKKVT